MCEHGNAVGTGVRLLTEAHVCTVESRAVARDSFLPSRHPSISLLPSGASRTHCVPLWSPSIHVFVGLTLCFVPSPPQAWLSRSDHRRPCCPHRVPDLQGAADSAALQHEGVFRGALLPFQPGRCFQSRLTLSLGALLPCLEGSPV